jgi:hypothetical protein
VHVLENYSKYLIVFTAYIQKCNGAVYLLCAHTSISFIFMPVL